MKKTMRIGIGRTYTATTATSNLDIQKWYDIELEMVEDRIVARCLNVQGAVTDGATEDEALDNIIEAIQGIEETRHDH